MTRYIVRETLKIPFSQRYKYGPIFEWEHCAKKFCKISNDLAMYYLMRTYQEEQVVLKVESDSGTYYFGIGLKDCDNITLKDLKKLYKDGTWYVYTWAA